LQGQLQFFLARFANGKKREKAAEKGKDYGSLHEISWKVSPLRIAAIIAGLGIGHLTMSCVEKQEAG
jgi:hypothetical protein